MAYRVFISYSTRDLALANHLRELILRARAEPYLAEYSTAPGTNLSAEII